MRHRERKIERQGECRVFWGSHGCHKQRGHLDSDGFGGHRCGPGCWFPDETTELYGEDAPSTPHPVVATKPEASA